MQNGKLYAKLTRSFLRKWCKYPYIINIRFFPSKLVTILIVVGQSPSFKRSNHACKRPVWVDKFCWRLVTKWPKICQKIRRNERLFRDKWIEKCEKIWVMWIHTGWILYWFFNVFFCDISMDRMHKLMSQKNVYFKKLTQLILRKMKNSWKGTKVNSVMLFLELSNGS